MPRDDVRELIQRPRGEGLLNPGVTYGDDLFTNETSGLVLVFHARQGGGNDECWCDLDDLDDEDEAVTYDGEQHLPYCLWLSNRLIEDRPGFLAMEYDDFDSTYNYFFFEYDGTADDYVAAEIAHEAATRENQRLADIEMLENRGIDTSILDDPNIRVHQLIQTYDAGKDEDFSTAEVDERRIELERGRAAIIAGDEEAFAAHKVSAYGRENIRKYHKAIADNLLADRIEEEVNELPENSALYEFLFRDNGTLTYDTKEVPPGKRRAVKVRKTVQRPTDLQNVMDKLRTKPNQMDYLKKRAFDAVQMLDLEIAKVSRERNDILKKKERFDDAKHALGL